MSPIGLCVPAVCHISRTRAEKMGNRSDLRPISRPAAKTRIKPNIMHMLCATCVPDSCFDRLAIPDYGGSIVDPNQLMKACAGDESSPASA
jgi:hypothetical protein